MAERKQDSSSDNELKAISSILKALNDLDGESIQRVLDYVFSRLSLPSSLAKPFVSSRASSNAGLSVEAIGTVAAPVTDIRTLKEQKQPESANQMAALVAYYVSEVATGADRQGTIGLAELERYFKQAGFKLPKALAQTLQNATAAGYLESLGDGRFKLNPVGYNLVVHALPRPHEPTGKKKKKKAKASK